MKIIFTGASSFTGMWFIQELVKAGHQVVATFQGAREGYEGLRRERVNRVCAVANQSVFHCAFGSERFLEILGNGCELLCHHGAETRNYKSNDFDVMQAVASNTYQLREVLRRNIQKLVLTGSVFAAGMGLGSDDLHAMSPYGLSKGITSQLFQYYCREAQVPLSQFVIANPFGPYEEARFVDYLMRQWLKRRVALVNAPLYVRDNIPVSLLAKVYVRHCAGDDPTIYPSGYVGSQAEFTERLAQALRPRLGVPCEYLCADQLRFDQPAVRINIDLVDQNGWDEESAWDELAKYYLERYPVGERV